MVIVGIGIDFVPVKRMEEVITRRPRIISKLFTENEIEFCKRRLNQYEALAARFAAKEAMLKALGVGWRRGVKFTDMVVKKEPSGKPILEIEGRVKEIANDLGVGQIFLTISHTDSLAVANVVLVK